MTEKRKIAKIIGQNFIRNRASDHVNASVFSIDTFQMLVKITSATNSWMLPYVVLAWKSN